MPQTNPKKDELQTKTISENQALHILPILPSDLETICFHLRQPISVSASWNHGIDRIPQCCKISLSQISLSVEILISIFNLRSWMPNKKIPPLVPNTVVVYPGSSAGLSSMGIAGLAAVALAAGRPTAQRGSIAVQAYDAWLEAQRERNVLFFLLVSCAVFWVKPFFWLKSVSSDRWGVWETKQTWHSFQANKHSWTCSWFAGRK